AAAKELARLPVHPRLARLLLRSKNLKVPRLGADLASLLSERDIIRRWPGGGAWDRRETDIGLRLDALHQWRRGGEAPEKADLWALRHVDRTSRQLLGLLRDGGSSGKEKETDPDIISRLLLCAFPDRIARLREEGDGRFVLATGRGVRTSPASISGRSRYIVAVNADAGEKAEGTVHLAAPVSEETIREELAVRIEKTRRVEWDETEGRVVAASEERIGAVLLSSKPFSPGDGEAVPLVCGAIRKNPGMIVFSDKAVQFLGRVALMKRAYPEEDWPGLSAARLLSEPEEWLSPWLRGVRNIRDLNRLDPLPALQALLSWEQTRLLNERAPESIVVPSGHRVPIDYGGGDVPVLAVKLQEMFGLADTPTVAGGRVKLLLLLLSPARRPVQITQDLKGFWNSGYQQVKKELKGRYPKHPWPDDPWNALPTRGVKRRSRA
ncbi:MAG: hypothetical protein M0Z60_06305, partial [Nitrospiraceae bacterium]|nr:hypothetical protein [Nitrospiraceae bacterium]